jgi:hypothetical protein
MMLIDRAAPKIGKEFELYSTTRFSFMSVSDAGPCGVNAVAARQKPADIWWQAILFSARHAGEATNAKQHCGPEDIASMKLEHTLQYAPIETYHRCPRKIQGSALRKKLPESVQCPL